MSLVDRLKVFIDSTGKSNGQFADEIGLGRGNLSQILSGRNKKINNELLAKIHTHYPHLNLSWLLFGEGSMFESSVNTTPPLSNDINVSQNQTENIHRNTDEVEHGSLFDTSNADEDLFGKISEQTSPQYEKNVLANDMDDSVSPSHELVDDNSINSKSNVKVEQNSAKVDTIEPPHNSQNSSCDSTIASANVSNIADTTSNNCKDVSNSIPNPTTNNKKISKIIVIYEDRTVDIFNDIVDM